MLKQRKKISLDCFGAKRLSDLLALPGIALVLLFGYLWQWSGEGRFIIGIAAGTALLLAGLIVGWPVAARRCINSPGFPDIFRSTAPAAGKKSPKKFMNKENCD